MAKLPTTIFNECVEKRKEKGVEYVTERALERAFIAAGYGEDKARKWIRELVDINGFKRDPDCSEMIYFA